MLLLSSMVSSVGSYAVLSVVGAVTQWMANVRARLLKASHSSNRSMHHAKRSGRDAHKNIGLLPLFIF